MSVHDFAARRITGEEQSLSEFAGFVLLIVNTASKCGFTPQYRELQQLYDKYHERGLEILGFPCNQFGGQEPGSEDEILEFCQVRYGVTFPMFSKTKVKGPNAHPLFQYLSREAPGIFGQAIKWNFTKFLINREGRVVRRFAPATKPEQLEREIESILQE
ncbi:glutathione peroxidase [Kroppenstedtia guangzhouensis]|uniref:Glutathione peroxidase n=1 Tax=Kroppenstedtia guangzhouensis TaxID=1274356 RepID=A0ABQ1GSU2_9BACL|nr:glutathione peroxidase [Kroppenstedtia guangzhouensis]GGA49720.1 glutathione peroxidase [Kroppenstedtia guangzhouensis]